MFMGAAMGGLLCEVMAMVDRDIMHPIWVSLKERKSFTWVAPVPFGFPDAPSLCSCTSFGIRHN
jgi:hypothetical protein